VKFRHAGERQHPGSFSVHKHLDSGSAGMTGTRVGSPNLEPLGLEPRRRSVVVGNQCPDTFIPFL
jgi:hypothetical protein